MKTPSATRGQHGFTIVELMVAITIGLVLTGGVISLFLQTRVNNRQNDNIARMQENGRYAIQLLRDDLAHAAFFGDVIDPGTITGTPSTIGSDCGANFPAYAINPAPAFRYDMNVAAASMATSYACIDGSEFQDNGNILAIRRTRASFTTAPVLNTVYVQSNGNQAQLVQSDGTADAGFRYWEYAANVYYIDTDNTLRRERLLMGATPTMASEPLVDGIEYFHVEFGIDNSADGVPDLYTPTPDLTTSGTTSDIERAATARIYVLVRSPEPDFGYTDTKTYQLGSVSLGPFNDNRYRRVYSTTVVIKNTLNRILLGVL